MRIKQFIIKNEKAFKILFYIYYDFKDFELGLFTKRNIKKASKSEKPKIYYCGIPAHGNLGDLAQGVCIRRWLAKNYPDYQIIEIETNALVNTNHSCLKIMKKTFVDDNDFIVFQSGYTTTDLGGYADLMHQAVMNVLPNAKILMMPQTILFKSKERKELCSKVYDKHKRMLFLARDQKSFEMAKEMFPSLQKMCFPDIVTTLIGSLLCNQNRDGILFCLRDDGEKFYPDEDLNILIERCKTFGNVERTDTTKGKEVIKQSEKYIYSEIEKYSEYKLMITDRYHGTILSLVAGTPVIIIKTTDHKVTTGADWFKGIYDNYVFLAKDLDDAYRLAKQLYCRNKYETLNPYFEENYYNKLPGIFAEMVK